MDRDFDVIIAGAGPAGTTAAIFAARAGLSVLLTDKRRFPRDKICGDAVARKGLGVLRELGLLEAVRAQTHEPVGKTILVSPDQKHLHITLGRPGLRADGADAGESAHPHLICRRVLFDNVLMRAAKQETDVLEDCPVTGLLVEKGRVQGIKYQAGNGKERQYTANLVVGADGYNSVVARGVGLYRFDPERWFTAARAYFKGLDCPGNTVEIHFVSEILPGFLWMFPTGDGVVNVGLGMIHKDIRKRPLKLKGLYEALLDSPRFRPRFQNAERLGPVQGWNLPTPDWRRKIHGDGFILAGDAAGLVDPFSGEGIGNAMISGKVAAHVAGKACAARNFSAAVLAEYPRKLWKTLDVAELKLHYRLRRLARCGPLINFLIGRAAEHHDVLEWITSMTAERGAADRKKELMSPLTYLKLMIKSK